MPSKEFSIKTGSPIIPSPTPLPRGQAARNGDSAPGEWAAFRRRGRVGIPTAVAVVLILVLGGGWSLNALNANRAAGAGNDVFVVSPRSFLVELKEKGELKAANSVDIKSEVEGRSTIISVVAEGTAVEKGDLLVELASDQLSDRITQEELKEAGSLTAYEAAKTDLEIQIDRNASDIRKADLDVELKNLALEKYEEGDWVQQVRDADVKIAEAELTLERERKDFEAAGQLLEKEFITEIEYEQDEFAFKKAKWDLDKANLAKKILEDYTRKADLAKQTSDRDEAIKERERIAKNAESEARRKTRNVEGKKKELEITRTRLAKMKEQYKKCRITAPSKGFVVYYAAGGRYWSSDAQIKEGATVHERQVLMQLPNTSKMVVTLRIHEAKTDKISLGQAVVVDVEGIPGVQFSGKVTKIAVVADSQNRWLNPDLKEYETEVTLDHTDTPLKPGATAHCRILVEEVTDQLAVPVQTIYTKAGQSYVFRRGDAGTVEAVEIDLGSVASEWAQINSGLKEDDPILLAFSEDQTRLIPDEPAGQASQSPSLHHQRASQGKAKTGKTRGEPSKAKRGRGSAQGRGKGHQSPRG